MTASSHKKAFKQLRAKESKLKKFMKHNAPKERSCGRSLRLCIRCGRTGSHIRKYGLNVCRQCFREVAQSLGFKKFS